MNVEVVSPVQNLEAIDVMAVNKDGSVLMVIVCAVHLDDSPSTLERLRGKIGYYLQVLDSEEFHKDIGGVPRPGSVTIEVRCPDLPDQGVLSLVYECMGACNAKGVERLVIQRDDGGRSIITTDVARV